MVSFVLRTVNWDLKYSGYIRVKCISASLRGPVTLTWELQTGDCKITLDDKRD